MRAAWRHLVIEALGPAEVVLPETVEPAEAVLPETVEPAEVVLPETIVEPESVDSTPVSGIWSFSSERFVVGARVTLLAFTVLTLLVLAAVGAFLFWRRRRPE